VLYILTHTTHLLEPDGNFVVLISSHVEVDDCGGQEGRQSDDNHIEAEESSCNIDKHAYEHFRVSTLKSRRR